MRCETASVVAYTIDRENRITWVCQHWWPFARDNDGLELRPERVVGSLLLDYVTDDASRQLYGLLIDRIRKGHRPIVLDIRCDSPDKRRFLKIRIRGLADGVVAFASRTMREESRPPVALFQRSIPHSDEWVRMCSWCKRIVVGADWVEVEEAIGRLEIFQADRPPALTHGLCPDCYQKIRWRVT